MPLIRVLLADDHPVVRSGIRNLLNREPDIQVVGEARDGTEALRMVQELEPDVLVLDVEMPEMAGIEVARRLQALDAGVKVLVLSGYDDRHYILGLLESGAAGYLVKDEAPQAIVEAVRGVWQGQEGWLSRSVAARVTNWMQTTQAQVPDLSPREKEVLRLVVAGKTNQAIGQALDISEKTVEKHLRSVFAKLEVSSRVEAAVWAVRQGLF